MAVQYVKEKNNFLGALGGLATLGGIVTGQPWLSTLGAGLGAANGMMNGNSSDVGALGQILSGIINGTWKNPADGNIAKVRPETDMTPLNYVRAAQNGALGIEHKMKGFSNGGY